MIPSTQPYPVSGYILAGGRSTRMGQDKALLHLAGKPLIEHAVHKLRRLCAEVAILSANPALAAYAPLVPDLHPGCGPLSGTEAALAHTSHNWSLILPIDVPFLPYAMLEAWTRTTLPQTPQGTRLAMYTVAGSPQPALLLIHRELAPSLTESLQRGDYKLLPALEAAATHFAATNQLPLSSVFRLWPAPAALPFANLNTPEDFADAERNINALDP